jgi:protein arginine kinase activator
MLCQVCKTQPATVKISHTINEKKMEFSLCQSCAEEKGMSNPLTSVPEVLNHFLFELLGNELLEHKPDSESATCSGCGQNWDDFQKTGLLGCEICYQVFESELNVILRRIHGSNQHIGSRPSSRRSRVDKVELQKIRLELQAAIDNENFELAAELRDLIRDSQVVDAGDEDGILR